LSEIVFSHSLGHEDQFMPPGLSGRHRFSQPTFTETDGNERDAPKAALRFAANGEKHR